MMVKKLHYMLFGHLIKLIILLYTTVIHMIINLLGGVVSPWAIEKINEEDLIRFAECAINGDVEGFMAIIQLYTLPFVVLLAYSVIMNACSIVGFVLLMKNLRRVRFSEGLLRPAEENQMSNFFLNGGICSAIAMFTGVFLLSLFRK